MLDDEGSDWPVGGFLSGEDSSNVATEFNYRGAIVNMMRGVDSGCLRDDTHIRRRWEKPTWTMSAFGPVGTHEWMWRNQTRQQKWRQLLRTGCIRRDQLFRPFFEFCSLSYFACGRSELVKSPSERGACMFTRDCRTVIEVDVFLPCYMNTIPVRRTSNYIWSLEWGLLWNSWPTSGKVRAGSLSPSLSFSLSLAMFRHWKEEDNNGRPK